MDLNKEFKADFEAILEKQFNQETRFQSSFQGNQIKEWFGNMPSHFIQDLCQLLHYGAKNSDRALFMRLHNLWNKSRGSMLEKALEETFHYEKDTWKEASIHANLETLMSVMYHDYVAKMRAKP